jgi:hypoxanthine phosphoribosyltransferase
MTDFSGALSRSFRGFAAPPPRQPALPCDNSRVNPPPGHVLIPQAQIAARLAESGAELTRHYAGRRPLFLGVMNGALFFLADLVRAVRLDVEISCVRLDSYTGAHSTGQVRGLDDADLSDAVRGREVLIVDDILDTGRTLHALVTRLELLGAADVKICVLLDKQRSREMPARADWAGFPIADEFVVGYGLDYNGRHRQLRDIFTLDAGGTN